MRLFTFLYAISMLQAGCAASPAGATRTAHAGTAAAPLSIQLDNGLGACVELVTEGAERVRNVVVLRTRMRILQSLAACGCKTALLGYRVRLDDPWRSGVVGRFDTNNRALRVDEEVYLLLSTDAPLLAQARTANISVSCNAASGVSNH